MKKIFDRDNIYDRLFAEKIDGGIKNLIANGLGNHFPDLSAIWLIQRWGDQTG